MFCYQCEQTAQGSGCTRFGVCGKDPRTAAMQDLLVYICKGISTYARRIRELGNDSADPSLFKTDEADLFVIESLFSTVTNVNFDPEKIKDMVLRGAAVRERLSERYSAICEEQGIGTEEPSGPAAWQVPTGDEELETAAARISILERLEEDGETVTGLKELVTYGLKGAAAYADHARILGVEDQDVYAFFHETLDDLTKELTADELFATALRVGEKNIRIMEMLDEANTGTYGHPEPTEVRVTPLRGKAIVVSGHDLKDLEELLKQTDGMGINVYTHGEMLPALAYPGLKKYPHLAGNYGGAWQDQQKEFGRFPGAILMTTNCIQRPQDSYHDRIFTSGLVQWPGVVHIENRDFTPVIEAALSSPGFREDSEARTITVGFARNSVISVADEVISAVKSGKIRHFFLIGGCDGAKPGRNYYTELAGQVPDDCVILTLACGKYRFNKMEFGSIDGIPRLLDVGQCNDAYSAIKIAMTLAEAFECSVNDLPLSLILSWYEQKAVAILLSLLHLGIRDMRLGPSLPAFLSEDALMVLIDKFNIIPISSPEKDLERILG